MGLEVVAHSLRARVNILLAVKRAALFHLESLGAVNLIRRL